MKVDSSKACLVRGVYVFSQWRAGCVSEELAKDDNCLGVGIAYTPWHRHDDDPAIVEGELEALHRCYSKFRDCDAAMMHFEYRPYDN